MDSKQLDGTTDVHRPDTCVYGMLWMGHPFGPESDHLYPWAKGRSGKTKYRCNNCHDEKTQGEVRRVVDKRVGIMRSPTAPVEEEDPSTTYDVDTDHAPGGSRRQTKLSFSSGGVD